LPKKSGQKNSLLGVLINLSKAAAMVPDDPSKYCDFGMIAEELEDPEYAIRCYKLVIQSDKFPEEGKAYGETG